MEVKTVTIKTAPCEGNEKGEVRINESDFDPKTMTLVGGEENTTDAALISLNKGELRDLLDANKIEYDAAATKADLLELAEKNNVKPA